MNWESSILNKIYRTKDFKISFINTNCLKDKSAYIEKITKYLELYSLESFQIRINDNAALHKLKPNKNTFYFSFNLNSYFYLYSSIFDVENKYINHYSIWEIEGTDKDELQEEKERKGKYFANLLKKFLFRFLFSNEYEDLLNDIPLKEYFRKLDCHFKFRNYLLGNSVTLYDIILLSILFSYKENTKNYVNIIDSYEDFMKSGEENNDKIEFKHLQRWIFTVKEYSAIDLDKLDKIRQSYYKEYLFETFKLTSNLKLVELVMRLGALKDKDKELTEKPDVQKTNKSIDHQINIPKHEDQNSSTVPNENHNEEEEIYKEIKSLLDSGENVNSRENQTFKTLAHLACRMRNMRLLKLLLQYEADLEAIDFEYMTPIYEAVITGDFSLCRFLIDDLKINLEHREIQNRTAFYWVACNGYVAMIKYLITKGCDVNVASKMGRTPLSKACWNGKKEVVEILVNQPNIEINSPDRNGRYPIHNAVWGVNGGRAGKRVTGLTATDNPECAKLLIENGALIEVQDSEGYTPLMIAASTNGVGSLIYLLEKNGNVNTENKYGATALIECSRYGNWECVKILLENSKDLEIQAKDNSGMSAMDYAILLNRIEPLDIFLNKLEFSVQEYLDIIIMSLYSRKIKTFEFILSFFIEKKIIEKFSCTDIYYILEKMIIIHQYDKFFLLIKALSDLAETKRLKFDFSEIEINIDLIILSVLSLKIFIINREKTKQSSSKDASVICRSFDENGEKDFDDFEDEIREKIINNLKNNENLYNNPNSSNHKDETFKGSCSIQNTLSFVKLQNLDCLNSSVSKNTCSSADDDKSVLSFESSENEKIRRFESYLEKRVEKLKEKKIKDLQSFKNYLEKSDLNSIEILKKETLIPQKFIKLLVYMKSYDSLKIILSELISISRLMKINFEDLLKDDIFIDGFEKEGESDVADNTLNSKSFLDIEKLEKLENIKIKSFLSEILFEAEIIIKEEKFNYKYSLNKKKKEDNYFGNWKKHLYTFNNHNSLSLLMKNVFDPEKEYKKEKEMYFCFLNSEIFGLFLFSKLKNHKNILHLIFPKTNTFEVLDEILQFIKNKYSKKVKLLISMVNSTDRNNLTPIDIAIKKKNYDMVEVYTKIINEFLIQSEIIKNEKEIIEEIKTNNALTNFIDLNEYKDNNVLYKIVSYRIKDDNLIFIPDDYKNYLKRKFLELENKIKNIADKEDSITNVSNGYYEIAVKNDTSYKSILENVAVDLSNFIIQEKTIADILKRNNPIIKEINANKLNSHFNFNRKNKTNQINETNNNYDNKINSNFFWVDNKEKLEFCISHLNSVKYIGVDLEFHNYKSTSTYNGIVCVIQVSSIENTFAIDSLILDQNTIRDAIKPIFEDENILKVFHGCDNDLNFLISNYQIFTRNFIDTGRTFLSFQKSILNKSFKMAHLPSLSYLAKIFLKCELDKSYQKADWRIRPLTKNMLSYALSDAKIVLYLFEIFVGLYNYLNENILETNLNNLMEFKLNCEDKKDQNIYYEELILRLRENKLTEKEMKTMKETSAVEKKNIHGNYNNRFVSLLFESGLKSLEIIKQKLNFEYKKIEITLN